jgi:beta-glucosidase/6-phospho-beta-glucosidase/beta-galactosidase/ABC-type amino acid transport substrate-binding protein
MTIGDKLKGLLGRSELPALLEPFMFGVATADHQCEAYDTRWADIRDKWEAMSIHNPLAARGKATDFWNRYSEDIELAASLGCKAFRFSVAWSRVEPRASEFDSSVFDHYQNLIEEILSHNMKPMLTLHHFTWPVHVEASGGMTGNNFPDQYAKYVKEVARHFSAEVPYWITFNEPNLLMGGYFKPWWDADYAAPPGLPDGTTTAEQVEAVGGLIRNLFLSNKNAYEIIKAENPKAQVGVNQYVYGLPRWLQRIVNRNISAIKNDSDLSKHLDQLVLKRDLIRGERISRFRAQVLEKNKVDVVLAALTRTDERETRVLFSEPYYLTRPQLMIKLDQPATDARDLDQEEIAVVRGTTSEQSLSKLLPASKSMVLDDYESALQALDHKQAFALLADEAILSGLMAQHPGKYMLLMEQLDEGESYAAAIAQGDDQLLNIVNSVMMEFKTSPEAAMWQASLEETTGLKVEAPPQMPRALELSESGNNWSRSKAKAGPELIQKAPVGTVLRRIQDRGYVVVAVREDIPGFGYKDPETGELSGLEILLARRLSQRIFGDPSKVRFHPVTPQERMAAVETKSGFLNWITNQYAILSTMPMANWWYMGMAGELDDYLCPPGCENKMDFIGLDYYWGIPSLHIERLQHLMNAAYRRFDQAPVYPEGLYNSLVDLQHKFPGYPIIICENGCVMEADGWSRVKYIQKHVKQVQRAIKDGIRVEGYICWAVTSNREWDLVFNDASDFGLYHVELDHDPALIRHRTPAAEAFAQIIRDF